MNILAHGAGEAGDAVEAQFFPCGGEGGVAFERGVKRLAVAPLAASATGELRQVQGAEAGVAESPEPRVVI